MRGHRSTCASVAIRSSRWRGKRTSRLMPRSMVSAGDTAPALRLPIADRDDALGKAKLGGLLHAADHCDSIFIAAAKKWPRRRPRSRKKKRWRRLPTRPRSRHLRQGGHKSKRGLLNKAQQHARADDLLTRLRSLSDFHDRTPFNLGQSDSRNQRKALRINDPFSQRTRQRLVRRPERCAPGRLRKEPTDCR